MLKETTQFLQALHGPGLEEAHGFISIWTLADKRTTLFETVEDAAGFVATMDGKSDTYTGVCLSPLGIKATKRASSGEVTSIGGLFIDIDIAGEAHKKSKLPPDSTSAASLINYLGIAPTLVIHTGHGLQPHWLFKEPIAIDGGNRNALQLAMVRWHHTWEAIFKSHGYTIDSTFDMARLCRVPGVANLKQDDGARAELLSIRDDLRYDLDDDIAEYLIDEAAIKMARSNTTAVKLKAPTAKTESGAYPRHIKQAIDNDGQFRDTWLMDRRDLDDDSPSSYDLALCNIGVRMGWTDQQLANCIALFREERNNKPEKGRRVSYLTNTIAIARTRSNGADLTAVYQDDTPDDPPATNPGDNGQPPPPTTPKSIMPGDDEKRKDCLRQASNALGVKIVQFLKMSAEQSEYVMITGDGTRVVLGGSEALSSCQKFFTACYDHGLFIQKDPKRWGNTMELLLRGASIIEDPGLTYRGETEGWVKEFTTGRRLVHIDEIVSASRKIDTMVYEIDGDERYGINPAELAFSMRITKSINIQPRELSRRLREVGLKPSTVMVPAVGSTYLWNMSLTQATDRGFVREIDVREWRMVRAESLSNTAANTSSLALPEPGRQHS